MPSLKGIWYEVAGEGSAVVLLHGGTGDSASYWAEQVPFFVREFKVITIDHRGYGESELSKVGNYLETCADDISLVLDHLGIAKTHVVGLSLGGRVAQYFALKYPHRLRRLVLADTLSGVRTEKLRRFIEDVLIGTAEKAGMEHVFDLNLLWAFSETYLSKNKDNFAQQREQWSKTSPKDFASVLKATKDLDMTDGLPQISAPTLVIWGSEDIETPRSYLDILVEKIPSAILVIIEGSGHKTCVEKPDEFNKIVRTFLRDA